MDGEPDIKLYGSGPTITTAENELRLALSHIHILLAPAVTQIRLGLFTETPDRTDLIRRGIMDLHNSPPERDAFACALVEGMLYLLGSTPRGVLHAVYALEETLRFSPPLPPDWNVHGVFRIGERHFHPRFDAWPGERADIRYLSRLGASHCLVCHDWGGSRRNLQGYVRSPVFPHAIPEAEVGSNNEGLHRLISDCRDYGLAVSLWITELPCQDGPWVPEPKRQEWLSRYPEEVLSDSGTYQGKVICFSHDRVQEFYRDLLRRFFAEFPEVETLYLFGMDSGGEGCDPNTCPRCRGMSKFEQRDRLIRFLVEEGNKVRPGLRVLTTGFHWDKEPEEFLERQAKLPAESGVYLAAQMDGWQAERQNHDFLRRVRAICRDRGQLFIGYDDFHLGDDATFLWGVDLQDFPLGIGAKMARWHDLEVDGVFDHWGTYNETVPSNSPACRDFFLNPLADPEDVCRRIAVNQYGPDSGESAFRAWQAIERAQRILSNSATWSPGQWPNWYAYKGEAPSAESFRAQSEGWSHSREAPKPALGYTYNGGSLADNLEAVAVCNRLAAPYFAEAARLLAEAAERAGDDPVGYAFFWNGAARTPGRKEHLERHRIYVEFLGVLTREIGIQFELLSLYERIDHDPIRYAEKSRELLREDLEACEAIIVVCDWLLREYPATERLSPGRWRPKYAQKVEGIRQLLGETSNRR